MEQHWLIADMDKLVGETLRAGISLLTDLGRYYREFIAITMFLIAKNCITTAKQSHAFTHGFLLELSVDPGIITYLWPQNNNQLFPTKGQDIIIYSLTVGPNICLPLPGYN